MQLPAAPAAVMAPARATRSTCGPHRHLYAVSPQHKKGGAGQLVWPRLLLRSRVRVFLLAVPHGVGADGGKGLVADVVLDLAGVFLRHLGVHPQSDEEAGQSVVPVQHTGGNGHAGVRQGDEPLPVHGDIAVFPQPLGGVADTGLGDTQMLRHVDGTDIAALLLHHQHGLQIVLRGFLYLHGKLHQPFSDISYRLTQTNQKCKERKKFSKFP